ncbi:LysR family transcriptional regulator [Streptomyces spectabilis]|uniref:DNA-binding transcriptional LysR family regulator n=1 Tax=Streptomyces spectabilis TaxID=68270 RepID=A0A5P2XIU1_STRST|nr:LysR family transcriptional regulator [Streptomyces spectabilis]MBB5105572.1 DNA-binding transcriptional LysR family regulator [Streptomyces spectabilis]MCI3906758.1 LysR family transcriptional regulator [Streptomyces spectabilis]QEV63564.1 LysR family transcriptional regulator [Streptomyces spectabilis]GGV22471.1 LysR family transcriptional regulator [Streptomyces spectabilis]
MRYDLDDLRLFLHIVTEGSITAGARRMHLSLPSASARVRSLERHAGVALLIRGRRGVRPTPAGTALARHARDVLTHTARLESAVASYTRSPAAPVTLLSGGSAMHGLVPRALVTFLREHPDTDVTVSESRTPRTVRMLADGEADLGVVVDDEAHDSGLVLEPLGDDSLVVIGQEGGILAGRTALAYSEVAEHPLVGLDAESSLRRWIERHLGPHAPVVRYRTSVAGLSTLVSLVAAGVGLAVVPRRALDPHTGLEVCALQDAWSRRRLLLAWGVGDRSAAPATAALAEQLRRAARTEAPPPGRRGAV